MSQVDNEGFSTKAFDATIDFKKDGTAVAKADRYLVTKCDQRRLRKNNPGMETSCDMEGWIQDMGSTQRTERIQPN